MTTAERSTAGSIGPDEGTRAALAQYLVLPPGYRPPPGAEGTPSPAESLLAQLRSLVELLAEVTERVHEHDARQLRVQAAFLGDKVRRSDLEL